MRFFKYYCWVHLNVDKKMNWVGFVFNGFILTNYYVQMSYERIEYDIDNFVSICDWM